MAALACLICLVVGFAEPDAPQPEGVIVGRSIQMTQPVVPPSLVDPRIFLNLLDPEALRAAELARARFPVVLGDDLVKAERDRRNAQRLLVHFTRNRVRTFTSNRPPEDRDLLDRIPQPDELVIVCDGTEQVDVDGRPTWKFLGNVSVSATKIQSLCHEATVLSDGEFLRITLTGGLDLPDELPRDRDWDFELTQQTGTAVIATSRDPQEHARFESALLVPAARIRQNVKDGSFMLKPDAASQSRPD